MHRLSSVEGAARNASFDFGKTEIPIDKFEEGRRNRNLTQLMLIDPLDRQLVEPPEVAVHPRLQQRKTSLNARSRHRDKYYRMKVQENLRYKIH